MISANIPSLYDYQQHDIELLFNELSSGIHLKSRLLYQLPTGGGKTLIFSEIVNRFIKTYQKKVIVLTHRIELCNQTSKTLNTLGVKTQVINSKVKRISKNSLTNCYVAMVETLKNRLNDGLFDPNEVGLVIIDEAHHNSFHKLLGRFKHASIIGVTATPFSADVNLPMNKFYHKLILGETIDSLIKNEFLAKPKIHVYDVELNSLQKGISGDFSVSTSDQLYGTQAMLNLLLETYQAHAKNKKTLIFNNGIITSKLVYQTLHQAGYAVKHLDNHTPSQERIEILKWFKTTKKAILTSVSILTTGFDEPRIQAIILNRATTSITLFHQMVGRGARRLNGKKTFTIVDLGNNTERFGHWHAVIDWQHVFDHPELYHQSINQTTTDIHHISPEIRVHFPKSLAIDFDVISSYQNSLNEGKKPKEVIRNSIRQHAIMCLENSENTAQAMELCAHLNKEINYRVNSYVKCIGNVTKNYKNWLIEDYNERLKKLIQKLFIKRATLPIAS